MSKISAPALTRTVAALIKAFSSSVTFFFFVKFQSQQKLNEYVSILADETPPNRLLVSWLIMR
jgi:hypothetical protein